MSEHFLMIFLMIFDDLLLQKQKKCEA